MHNEVTLFFETQKDAEEFAVQAALAHQAAAKPIELYAAVTRFTSIRLGADEDATRTPKKTNKTPT